MNFKTYFVPCNTISYGETEMKIEKFSKLAKLHPIIYKIHARIIWNDINKWMNVLIIFQFSCR